MEPGYFICQVLHPFWWRLALPQDARNKKIAKSALGDQSYDFQFVRQEIKSLTSNLMMRLGGQRCKKQTNKAKHSSLRTVMRKCKNEQSEKSLGSWNKELVLWKDEQIWQPLTWTPQRKTHIIEMWDRKEMSKIHGNSRSWEKTLYSKVLTILKERYC